MEPVDHTNRKRKNKNSNTGSMGLQAIESFLSGVFNCTGARQSSSSLCRPFASVPMGYNNKRNVDNNHRNSNKASSFSTSSLCYVGNADSIHHEGNNNHDSIRNNQDTKSWNNNNAQQGQMMARRDKENDHSVLNETGTTHQDSFFDESCSSLSGSNIGIDNGSGIARIPSSQPRRQEQPKQQLRLEQQEKIRMMVSTPRITTVVMSNSNCPPVMPLPVDADLLQQQQEQQKLLLLLPIPPPEIRRVSLEDAVAVTAQQRQYQSSQRSHLRHHRHNHTAMTHQRTMLVVGNNAAANNDCCHSRRMYDINGLPMAIPEPFSRNRSLDFLFSSSLPPSS